MNTIVSTQFLLPQAVVGNGAVTGNQWSNPNNILLVDGDVAASDPNQTASDITVGNFLTNIPQGAVITGLEFEIIARRGAQTNPVITLTPYLLDNTSGQDVYYPYVTPITTALTLNLTTITIGSPTYLFASAFTPDQINNAKFNLIANGDVSIDSFLMKVYYYIPSPDSPTPPPSGSGCDDCDSPIQAQPFYLALPFKSDDRYAYLKSFNYPDGSPIQYSDLGACGGSIKLVFDPAVPKINNSNFEENAVTAVWTVEANGYVKLDFGDINVNRGLMFHTPYTADSNLRSDHDANSKVIISDSGPFFGQYIQKCQAGFIFSKPIEVDQDETLKVKPAVKLNFKGSVLVQQNGLDPEQADIFITAGGGTTPADVVAVVSGTSGGVPSDTITLNLPISGLNRGAIFQLATEEGVTVTSILANGVPMTLAISDTDVPNNLRQEQYWIMAPALGVLTIVCILSAPASWSAGAEALVGVNQTNFIGNVNSNTGSNLNPSVNLTTTVDNSLIIDGLVTAMTPILYTVGPGQTSNWQQIANANIRQGGSSAELAGLQPDIVTSDYVITQSTPWVITNVEILGITTASASGQAAIQFEDEANNPLGSPGTVDEFQITGTPVTAVRIGNKVIYTISGTGGGGGGGNYIVDQTPDDGTYGHLIGAIDGTNTTFTVSSGLYLTGTLIVCVNGVVLLQGGADDWTETDPATGTFDLNVPPVPGDVVTAIYQISGGSTPQTGIQFDDENSNPLGSPATVDEFEITSATPGTVTGTRVGNKIIYTIVPGGGGGGGSPFSGSSFLPIGKRYDNGTTESGDTFFGNIFRDVSTNRLYTTFTLDNPTSSQFGTMIRIFKNDFGSYYVEKEVIITRSMLSATSTSYIVAGQSVSWTTDGNYLYAIVEYTKTSGGAETRIDIIRFDLDGTNNVVTNIYAVNTTSNTEKIAWRNSGHGTMAACIVGTQLFTTWSEVITGVITDQLREFTISGTTYTPANTYTRVGFDNSWDAKSLTFDPNTNTFYFTGGNNNSSSGGVYVEKYNISGSNFVLGANKTYPELAFGNQRPSSALNAGYSLAFLEFTSTYYSIYVVEGLAGSSGSLGAGQVVTAYWLQALNYPLF